MGTGRGMHVHQNVKNIRLKWLAMVPVLAVSLFCGPVREGMSANLKLSAWMTYWDAERGKQEYHLLRHRLSSVSYFAAYFNARGKLFVPDVFAKAPQKKVLQPTAFLTVVNDVVGKNGENRLKDVDILKNVLKDEEACRHHADELLELARKHGYEGVEVDYENVWRRGDAALQQQFIRFLDILVQRAEAKKMKVRVVLEPTVPFDAGFPKGASYVVMLYNLYGPHSCPGPKADRAFIGRICGKLAALQADSAVAFSTGGCCWKNQEKGTFITQQEAMERAARHRANARRDEKSGALTYSYEENGDHYEVWYADTETLNGWIRTAMGNGINEVYLWSLGGNDQLETLEEGLVSSLL